MSTVTERNIAQSGRVRLVLRTGSIVFGLSAIALIAAPGYFNSLLGLTNGADLEWAMRMIGITLVALAGNMFSVSTRGSDESVLFSARVMLVSAFGLGVLTLLIPVQLTWFTLAYAVVGFSFSAAYAVALFGNKRR
jgi:O-antigen/teichoic acid export membrane protein